MYDNNYRAQKTMFIKVMNNRISVDKSNNRRVMEHVNVVDSRAISMVTRLDENSVTAAARDRGNDDDKEEANAAASVNGRNEGHRRRRRTSPLRHTKGGASADDSHDRSSTTTRPYSTRDDICQKIACRGYPTVADSRLKPSADVGGMNHSTTASRPAATSHQPQQVIYFFAMRAPLHLVNERNLGSDFLSAPTFTIML
ncbi:hypothetical protein Q1695_013415 [Nippostrongylus brasiliensis]|nr:hypothetical protein Q1695_013415 [Nippostrongylus brasiliensis]